MLQSFEELSDPSQGAPRVTALRHELARLELDGFIIPHADEYQNEYLPPCGRRLAWLTGFTGSAGLAIVLSDKAIIFVDGRYTLQVPDQVDGDVFDCLHLIETPPDKWIKQNLPKGAKLGFDPKLHTIDDAKKLKKSAEQAEAVLVPCDTNPIDIIWHDRPPPPLAPLSVHELRYSGTASDQKRADLSKSLKQAEVDAVVLTSPASIAWLLNIRGRDVDHTPLPLCFAIGHEDGGVDLFVDRQKVGDHVTSHLGTDVRIQSPDGFGAALTALGEDGKKVQLDPADCSAWVHDLLKDSNADIHTAPDPCVLPRARKNDCELAGTRAAHKRDGAALTRFLAWLSNQAPNNDIDEIAVVKQLEAFRSETGKLQDLSFDTIAGSGPNSAIVHYRVSTRSNRKIQPGELLLVDSGGQYLDGTTDVTRTIAIGAPTDEMRDRFTRVLKGHIGIALARFPKGTTGAVIDVLARQALWRAGLDFDHGTGHGVGSYLNVHEGPQGISRRATRAQLEPGMILSNEPGYYKAGAFGIRIENLVVVTPLEAIEDGERPMMGFDTITFAPIDLNLIDWNLLTQEELQWLNAYHARVRRELTPLVDDKTAQWLKHATRQM